jgi:flavin-dependent dehydrogenase
MRPVVIAGGGLAGSAAAILLARAGQRVELFERQRAPVDKICGEFLSREAQLYLRRLGLDPAALGGHVITRLRLVRSARVREVALPFAACGLSRRVLDEALLTLAAESGATVRRGEAVQPPVRPDAAALFLATGKHAARGVARAAAGPAGDLVGFKTYFSLAASQQRALAGHIEVMLFTDGYAGLQLVEGGRANLCLLTSRDRLRRAGGNFSALLQDLGRDCAHLTQRLAGAAPLLDRPLAISRVPYGFVHRARADDPPDLFRLGDQVGVIDSFSGDGMSIALHSAAVAAEVFLAGGNAAAYHQRIRRDIAGQIRRASLLHRIGRAPLGQAALMGLAGLWPQWLRLATAATRVPDRALRLGLS